MIFHGLTLKQKRVFFPKNFSKVKNTFLNFLKIQKKEMTKAASFQKHPLKSCLKLKTLVHDTRMHCSEQTRVVSKRASYSREQHGPQSDFGSP